MGARGPRRLLPRARGPQPDDIRGGGRGPQVRGEGPRALHARAQRVPGRQPLPRGADPQVLHAQAGVPPVRANGGAGGGPVPARPLPGGAAGAPPARARGHGEPGVRGLAPEPAGLPDTVRLRDHLLGALRRGALRGLELGRYPPLRRLLLHLPRGEVRAHGQARREPRAPDAALRRPDARRPGGRLGGALHRPLRGRARHPGGAARPDVHPERHIALQGVRPQDQERREQLLLLDDDAPRRVPPRPGGGDGGRPGAEDRDPRPGGAGGGHLRGLARAREAPARPPGEATSPRASPPPRRLHPRT